MTLHDRIQWDEHKAFRAKVVNDLYNPPMLHLITEAMLRAGVDVLDVIKIMRSFPGESRKVRTIESKIENKDYKGGFRVSDFWEQERKFWQ